MARGNAAMQKKLAELESEIGRLLDQPSSYINDDIDGKVGSYQTARKISFIKNLLTAEMDSHSGGRPEHLNDMAMRLSVLEKTFVNWVASGYGNGAVNKSSDTSASCSCTESCIVDEEFVEEDNVNQEAKEFGALETETILSEESKEEGIENEVENKRNQEEETEEEREVEVTMDEKRRDRKQGEMVGESTEVTEDKEEGRERIQGGKVRESNVEVNEDEEAGEQQQEMVEERKVVEKKVKVEATEGKRGWKQEGEMVGERKFKAEQDKGSERKEGTELGKDEKETERNQERQTAGVSIVEVIDDKQEERKEEGEMVGMQKIEVKEDEKGRERKQQSYKAKNCMAMGFATAAGFAIALIGVAVANAFWVEETVYLVPT